MFRDYSGFVRAVDTETGVVKLVLKPLDGGSICVIGPEAVLSDKGYAPNGTECVESTLESRTVKGIYVGGIYKHFKGAFYEVLCVADDVEYGVTYVVYRAKYGEQQIWCRPLDMFTETVQHEGTIVGRFTLA